MPPRDDSSITSFDGDAALKAALAVVDGTVYSFVEYDVDDFNVLYVDDATLAFYRDEEHMLDHFAKIHSHVNMDFMEIELFRESLFPISEEVRFMTTGMDYLKLLRIYSDLEGVFLALEPHEPVMPIVDALDEIAEL